MLGRSGQRVSAVETYRRALELAPGLGDLPPALEGNYALGLIELGRAYEAMPLIEHAAAKARAKGDNYTAYGLLAHGARAWCLTHDLERCRELLTSAHSELVSLVPAGHSMFGTLELGQAQLALAMGNLAQAHAGLKRALAIFDSAGEARRSGITLALLARTELQLGDIDAALEHATQAVDRARDDLSGFAHSEWLGSALVARGLVQQARHDAGAARDSWRAALVELAPSVGETAPAFVEVRQLLEDPATAR